MGKNSRPSASELSSHIGYRLRVVSNAVSHAFAKKLSDHEVTVAEWVILRNMYSGDEKTSPSVVAQMTGLTRGAVSKLVDRLLNKGLVIRAESSRDRRFQEIKLTAKAIKLVPQLASLADDNDDSFFSVLSEHERKSLFNFLVKLAEGHGLNANPID